MGISTAVLALAVLSFVSHPARPERAAFLDSRKPAPLRSGMTG
jgi:hypothetical protein